MGAISLGKMRVRSRQCRHCGGDLLYDRWDRGWGCLQCSRTEKPSVFIPRTSEGKRKK